MQLIEQTGFGVRSAMLTLSRRGSPVTFVLFPMLHLGSPGFYRAVRRRLERCDVVVVEGAGGRAASLITLAYRIGGRVRRDGLVNQGQGRDRQPRAEHRRGGGTATCPGGRSSAIRRELRRGQVRPDDPAVQPGHRAGRWAAT
jgi:hypothetical protein